MLETRASRLRLAVRKKPYFIAIAPRVGLGYRRNQGPGTWIARGSDGKGGYWTKAIAVSDDHEDSDNNAVLSFWQAQDRAKAIVRGQAGGQRPITVAEALDHYAADLKSRTGDTANADRVRRCLPPSLAAKTVSLITARDLRHWRDALLTRVKASSADRTARMLKAALNLAARDDPRIVNASAWKTGLVRLPEVEPPPNKIISDEVVRAIVKAAHRLDHEFGLLVEIAATAGARTGQMLSLEVRDLHDADSSQPKLTMPSSRKGRRRRVSRLPLPIPAALARELRRHAGERDPAAPLFVSSARRVRHAFQQVAADLGLDGVTLGSLRHSSIVRQLLAGVPARVVAAHHDTSLAMLEHTYSRHIGTVSDAVVRRALIDMGGNT
jgi:hypothetical protein